MSLPKPEWLKIRVTETPNRQSVEDLLGDLSLNTVCAEANCPNYNECFNNKTATFMILGIYCTRNCRFCNVTSARPQQVDTQEPQHIGEAVARMGLRYVVVTSVTRDDLPDGGAAHFAKVIQEIRKQSPKTKIEVLIPDLQGNLDALKVVSDAKPDVISHNIETVPRLYRQVRPQAQYLRSLDVIEKIKELDSGIRSKTGIMVGLGETSEEVLQVLDDLRARGCEFLTIGQYLAPSKEHVPVTAYIHPNQFEEYKKIAEEKGFLHVASGPFVRSSYHADKALSVMQED